MTKRLDPKHIAVAGGSEADVTRFVESDYLIRSGACPNRCGLMNDIEGGQECPVCHFSCNVPLERTGAH